jgi:hypothetical protein
MDLLTGIGLALPAGLNAYIPLLGLAMAERTGYLKLPAPYDVLGQLWAVLLIALLLAIEILADKVPAADHVNDVLQTVVRPLAGALVMVATTAQLFAGKSALWTVLMVVLGIVLAGSVHAVKAASRPVVNVTTGGLGGPVLSLAEDVVAAVTTVLAIVVPVLAIVLVAIMLFFAVRWLVRTRRTRGAGEAEPPTAPAA